MVKFSREYDANIIPEWKGAFVDYKYLKKLVKKIKVEVGRRGEDDWTDTDALLPAHAPARRAGFSVLRRSLAARFGREVQVSPEDEESLYSSWGLVRPAGKHEREFLEKAGEELDKANSFYVAQEAKLLGHGEALIDQLRILADVKRILADHAASAGSPDPGPLGRSPASSHPPSSPAHSPGFSGTFLAALSSPRSMSALSGTLLAALASPQSPKSDWGAELQQAQTTTEGAAVPGNKQVVVNKARAGGTLQLPSTVRIDIPATNPGRTALKVWEELVNVLRKDGADPAAAFVHRRKIQHAEKNIRNAFIALYRGLDLLKKFSSLNAKAFAKILKKFVKVSGQQQATELFSQKVKTSSFSTSDKVLKLADEVESLFLNHFAGNDIMVAMKYLKPQQPKSTHTMTFLVGLFTGTFVSLFILYALLGNVSGIFGSAENTAYMEVVYHVFSIFTLISLHCFLYGCNLFLWKRTRINTNFIFDFASNTALTHQDAFLMAALIMCTVVAALVINLFLMNAGVTHADVVPGALLALSAGVLLCPFNVFYRRHVTASCASCATSHSRLSTRFLLLISSWLTS
uniref:Uncharacterized protein n=1 Tax=Avena sativa TaxID=4498 RepID=A0ACD5YW19_AVESA